MNARWSEQDLAAYQERMAPKGVLLSTEIRKNLDTGDHYVDRNHPRRIVVPGPPVAKPRQTQSDKWKKRPCVERYREWAALAQRCAGASYLNFQHVDIVAYLPIPQSLPLIKRDGMAGEPHRVKPDLDNIVKSCLDALLPRDQGIHEIRAKKRWDDGNGPRVEITIY